MKLPKSLEEMRNKSAEDFVQSNQCEVMDTITAHKDSYSVGFNDGALETFKLAEMILAQALRDAGLKTSASSMFTGEINKICKDALDKWHGEFKG